MKYLLLFLSMFLFDSCKENNENKTNLLGTWKTVNWTIDDTNRKRSNKMDFTFTVDDRYLVDYGSEKESGKFWFESNDLYTIEDGSAMKKVEVEFVNSDSIVMRMNRAGQRETVELIREIK